MADLLLMYLSLTHGVMACLWRRDTNTVSEASSFPPPTNVLTSLPQWQSSFFEGLQHLPPQTFLCVNSQSRTAPKRLGTFCQAHMKLSEIKIILKIITM